MLHILYIVFLIGFIIFYLLYHIYHKTLTKDIVTIIKNIIVSTTLLSIIYILLNHYGWLYFNLNRKNIIVIFISLTLLIYSFGLIINKEKTYKHNINLYLILFILLLISITFFIYRTDFSFNFQNLENILFYLENYQPFAHTTPYLFISNLVMLMPLSLLLMLKNEKYEKIFRQILIILPTILLIEIIEEISGNGSFDFDDIILNFSGAITFAIIISKTKLINYIKKIFYSDLKIPKFIKYSIYTFSSLIPLLFVISTIIKCLNHF